MEEFRRQLDEGMWAAVPTTHPAAAGARRRWSGTTRTSRRRRAGDLLPARLGRLTAGRCCSPCSSSRWSRRRWPRPLLAARSLPALARARADAPGGRAGPPTTGALRPGPRAPRRAARARAAALLRERRGVGDVPRPRLHPRGRPPRPPRRATAAGAPPTPTWSTRTSRSWPTCPSTGRLLSEYCVEFPDLSGEAAGSRLPASDDVLAKWMALTSDESRVIRRANMHLSGRQLDPARVRRDLWRLARVGAPPQRRGRAALRAAQ